VPVIALETVPVAEPSARLDSVRLWLKSEGRESGDGAVCYLNGGSCRLPTRRSV
jgi:hypothetical protein